MDINRKIEEIRQKPEHVRLRYIWGLVAISMLFVITIWILSVKESAKSLNSDNSNNLPDIRQSLEEIDSIRNTAPSIDELSKNIQDSANANEESLPDQENTPDIFQNQDDSQLPTINN